LLSLMYHKPFKESYIATRIVNRPESLG
ncbi:hypothetical protein E2320_016368, partial [Naja naja]